jgi:hypothetical protein
VKIRGTKIAEVSVLAFFTVSSVSRLEPVIKGVTILSPPLLVQIVGTTTNLFLKLDSGFPCLGWCLT